ncbi:MAG: hypothetical protein L6264_03300 [Weeksellaceae bacterium]|nr:hypothetical protein [Bacteroidota bacterium]MCG2779949.1 hypothetical protein [Weeksellaceae bacterium]
MKNLDIENLERKNIYKTPDRFFDDIQAKVLRETAPQKQAKVVKLNWAYAMAAAVAMVFGITFFVNQSNDSENTAQLKASNIENGSANTTITEVKPQKEATVAYQTLQNDLTSTAQDNQKENERLVGVVSTKTTSADVQTKRITAPVSEVQVDQMLSNFTSAELADLGKNTEQDIYLDLYN